jgi:cell division septation protein DedD
MQERTRYRVTGTLFLLALAVILVPMLFDGEGTPSLELPPIDAPTEFADEVPPYDEIVPQTNVVERVAELKAEIDDDGFAADTGTRFGEPILQPASEETTVFAVQAASFGKLENARSFREELRGAGYEAFLSTSKVDTDRLVHRVAIGPLLSRDDALTMQRDISAEYSVEARVMDMSQ